MIQEISSVTDALGLDPQDLEWQDLALCQGQDVWRFYEGYETDTRIAKVTDDMCRSCPVRAMCLQAGVENSEWGVWGGVYLNNGKPDSNRNAHKTQEDWDEIRRMLTNE